MFSFFNSMEKYKTFNHIAFDLDGTLCKSRCEMVEETREVFLKVLETKNLLVVGGGTLDDFKNQFLDKLLEDLKNKDWLSEKLFISPCNGAIMYIVKIMGEYIELEEQYSHEIYFKDIPIIMDELKQYGDDSIPDLVEDRTYQVTMSMLGKNAEYYSKRNFDRDHKKRSAIVNKLKKDKVISLDKYDIYVAGTTSIDVVPKKVSKGRAIDFFARYNTLNDDILFVGDNITPKGNDWSICRSELDNKLFICHVHDYRQASNILKCLTLDIDIECVAMNTYMIHYHKRYQNKKFRTNQPF